MDNILKKTLCVLAAFSFLVTAAMLAAATGNGNAFYDTSKFPFNPTLIRVMGGREVKVSDYTDDETCGGCHAGKHEQWKGSMHSNSFKDPVWREQWKRAFSEVGPELGNECLGCHTPVGTVARVIMTPDDIPKIDAVSAAGVQCDFCHTVASNHFNETTLGEPFNMAFTVDPGDVKKGPLSDSDSPFHQTVFSEIHTEAELCGNCHNVMDPKSGLMIEHTYDEWKKSVYAQNGLVCQDCHMIPVENLEETARTMKRKDNPGQASEIGPERPNIHNHEFVGGNFALTKMLGGDKQSGIAVKRLKLAASLDLAAPKKVSPGAKTKVTVRVNNVAAGHNLPTSLSMLRQMWLDVEVTDGAGRTVYRSGALDKNGDLGADAIIFNSSVLDTDGKPTLKPWRMVKFDYNRTIPPRGSAARDILFTVPKVLKGPLKFRATLKYRSFPQYVANDLLGKDAVTVPVVDMVEKIVNISI